MTDDANPRTDSPIRRDLLEKLSASCLRLSAGLDFEAVLQAAADGGRTVASAEYCAVELFGSPHHAAQFVTSGSGPVDGDAISEILGGSAASGAVPADPSGSPAASPTGPEIHRGRFQARGFALQAPLSDQGRQFGRICVVASREDGGEFTAEDEQLLLMFASHAAAAISNARAHLDQVRTTEDLQVLTNISLVGGLVFDARTGALISITDAAPIILSDISTPGQTMEQVLRHLHFMRADGRVFPLDQDSLLALLSSGETIHDEELLISTPDGRTLGVTVNAQPTFSEDGSVETVVVAVRTSGPSGIRSRARAEIAASVSRDVNSPLATIKGSTAYAIGSAEYLEPSDANRLFHVIDNQADIVVDYLNRLVDLTQLETGAMPLRYEEATLGELCRHAGREFRNVGPVHDIIFEFQPDLPPVMVDREQTISALFRLFRAVSHAGREPLPVSVTAWAADNQVLLSIAAAEKPPLRPPRQRQSPALSGPGSGGVENPSDRELGFVLARRIIEAQGGRIWLEPSISGHGVRVTLSMPSSA